MALDSDLVQLALDGPLARVTFNRPHVLNAGDRAWISALGATVRALQAAPGVRVVVLGGAGRAFSTGVDLTALAHGRVALADLRAWEDAMTALERLPAAVIAGINGHCLGGGLQLALVADYRLAREDALIGLPAVKECLIPSMALYRLPRLIGLSRAQELLLLGESIPAREAERLGLLHRVVPGAEFSAALEATVARFLALPPTSLAACKQLSRRAFDLGFDDFREEMERALSACLLSPEDRKSVV